MNFEKGLRFSQSHLEIKYASSKSAVFKSAMETYPILDPIVEIFVGALDKSVEQRVKMSADKIADALVENPGKTEEIISTEARKIADTVKVETPKTILEKITRLASKIKDELKEIKGAKQKVSSFLEAKREQEATIRREKEIKERLGEAERKRKEEEESIDCYCTCSRDGIRRFVGEMTGHNVSPSAAVPVELVSTAIARTRAPTLLG